MLPTQTNPFLRHLRRLMEERSSAPASDRDLLRRYVLGRDESAFAALVRRHGPMVLGVCERVLHNRHDAEDALQATFLVLARKAGSLSWAASIGPWLHEVAYRLAHKARADSARRFAQTAALPHRPNAVPAEDLSWRELHAVLDEELARLPVKYRSPLVLCYLEGSTRDEAARQLACPLGTLKSRLERGRELLRTRLVRRGVAPSAALAVAGLLQQPAGAVPYQFALSLSTAATVCTARPTAAGVSVQAVALAQELVRATALARLRLAAAVLLTVGMLAAGAGLLARPTLNSKPAEERQEEQDQPAESNAGPARPDDQPQARRDTYGDPLPAEALARLGTVRLRHGRTIQMVAFTPDGKRIVSHGGDGIRVWDAASGRETGFVQEGGGWIIVSALMPDGKSIVSMESGLKSNVIRVRGLSDLKPVREFEVGLAYSFRLSPDGKLLAILGEQTRTVEIWDLAAGRQLLAWKGHDGWIWTHQFSADGKTLVTGSADKSVRLWDVATGKLVREIADPNSIFGAAALSGDGKLLATVGWREEKAGAVSYFPQENRVRIWDAATGKELRQLTIPEKKRSDNSPRGVGLLTFAPDGKTLITNGPDDCLRFWDPATGKELRRLFPHSTYVFTLAFSPDGKALALVTSGNTISLIDSETGKDRLPLAGAVHGPLRMELTPDGRTLVAACSEPILRSWDVRTGRELRPLAGHEETVAFVRLSRDGRSAVSFGSDRTLRTWDVKTGKEISRLPRDKSDKLTEVFAAADFAALSPDGKLLAARVKNPPGKPAAFTVLLFDLASGKELHRLPGHEPWLVGAEFTPDGRTLVTWDDEQVVRLWDVATGEKSKQYSLAEGKQTPRPIPVGGKEYLAYAASLSPDGRFIAHASQQRFLTVQELVTGRLVRAFSDLFEGVSAVAFSADGRMLAWGGWREGPVHLVEIATGQERRVFHGHKGRIYSLTFSEDGQTLVSGSEDTTALVWDLTGRLGASKPGDKPPAAATLEADWADLAGKDASRAYRAMQQLHLAPAATASCLQRKLQPVAAVDEKRLERLIRDLDSDAFTAREKAAAELEALGEVAAGACRQALEGRPSAEVRRQLERLLEKLAREDEDPSPARLRTLRALEVLERLATPEARQLLKTLAAGAPGARLTQEAKAALRRLDGRQL